jgi:hypothetical protein
VSECPLHVFVAWPSNGLVHNNFTYCLTNLLLYYSSTAVFDGHQGITTRSMEGSEIVENRQGLKELFLESDATHFFGLDADMGFESDVLHILLRRKVAMVAANYRRRKPPFTFVSITPEQVELQTTEASKGLEESWGTGYGCVLIERKVFELVPERPYDQPPSPDGKKRPTSEDIMFFNHARQHFPLYIDHDASKKVWHHEGGLKIRWDRDYSALGD